MQLFLMIGLLVVALLLVGIILIQQGKGAEMGASFGAGGSNTLFGAPGAGNFLTKSTTVLAILFFAIAIAITATNQKSEAVSGLPASDEVKIITPETGAQSSDPATAEIPTAEIPTQKVEKISTEIPTAKSATVGTEIPTAKDVANKAKADAEKTITDKTDEAKKAADKKLSDLKDAADKKAEELKKKAGDQ